MGNYIDDLKRQIQKEKNILKGKDEMRKLEQERLQLEAELKRIKAENRGSKTQTLRKVGGELKTMGNKLLGYAQKARVNMEAREKNRRPLFGGY
jgi:adenylate kinase